MLEIRPISDLRNHFMEIEHLVGDGNPVFLTRNGYGSMVLLSLEDYAHLTGIQLNEDPDKNSAME